MDITNLRQTHHPSILITINSGTVFGPMCHGIVLSIFNPTAREDGNMPTSLISHKLPGIELFKRSPWRIDEETCCLVSNSQFRHAEEHDAA
ncbi:hypothetical protein E4U47_002480 [Claviceps purpurea]|nr:hypothetical protein E4U47_002480 [Claviceps purpurea]